MAEIAPFRGLRYNTGKVRDLAQVVIPPYDVISPEQQRAFHETNPYNMVRLELGESLPDDSAKDNAHTRAGEYLRRWQEEAVLIREELPGIYYYELDYPLSADVKQTRYGFVCVLKLEDFSRGSVRPHEKTFQAVKDERLGLMLACNANLSPVFALYSDSTGDVDSALRAGREAEPIFSFDDREGMTHRVWRVTDPDVLQRARSLMVEKDIFIADGHHRYETALNYRHLQRKQFPNASGAASFEYVLMYLSNLNDEGLTILPTHRLLRGLGSWQPKDFLENAAEFFEISRYDATSAGEKEWRRALEKDSLTNKIVIGLHTRFADGFYLFKAKPDPVSAFLSELDIPRILQGLDVVVLDRIVLRRLMGLSEEFLADERNIHFKHDFAKALDAVRSGSDEAGFFINATRIEQVQNVAEAGLIMPHKSTYFFPKVGSGLLIHRLSPSEEDVP